MLHSLYIKNFALIDEIYIEFQPKLNIVIGETGAGKSIIIDALMTTLGERTSPELVKIGEQKAIVEATFSVENPSALNSILNDEENLIENNLTLRREITSKGTSRCFLNDTPYPLSVIKDIGELLVDFHGQHSHQQLLSTKFQLEFLDNISDNIKLVEFYQTLRRNLENSINELLQQEFELRRINQEIDRINYDLQEILRIDPKPNELPQIEEELKKLENLEIINSTLNEVYTTLYQAENSVLDQTSYAVKKLTYLLKFYPSLKETIKQLENIVEIVTEVSKEIHKLILDAEFEPNYLDNLRVRLSELKYLEKKYLTFENIFNEKERMQSLVLTTYSLEDSIKKSEERIHSLKEELKEIALKISHNRFKGAELLETKVPEILGKLGMKNVTFKVDFKRETIQSEDIHNLSIRLDGDNVKLLQNGIDKIEFLIATNPNAKPMNLGSIASGGEISRIMLALKSLSAGRQKFPTMIFDEIDVGISGKIASMTAQLMKQISANHQVIAITHLPQIASAGNNTILVEKIENQNSVKISAKSLTEEEKVFEIAKLLSGEMISQHAIENAKKLISEINNGE
ncbi:MAG: DNA repair protein RecN [Candidatus Kapaibacteriota bacterium]